VLAVSIYAYCWFRKQILGETSDWSGIADVKERIGGSMLPERIFKYLLIARVPFHFLFSSHITLKSGSGAFFFLKTNSLKKIYPMRRFNRVLPVDLPVENFN